MLGRLNRSWGRNAFSQPSYPTKIQTPFDQHPAVVGLTEFTAWSPWGTRPPHDNDNADYIKIAGCNPEAYPYPTELQKLIDHGWKAKKPTAPAVGLQTRITIGRGAAPAANGGTAPGRPATLAPTRPGFKKTFGFNRLQADWDHIKLFKRVGAYSFRGDTRSPQNIQSSGGFNPPCLRTDDDYVATMASQFADYIVRKEGGVFDDRLRMMMEWEVQNFLRGMPPTDQKLFSEYHFWREVLSNQEMHLKGMTRDSFLKAYISTTRDIRKAWGASDGSLGGVGVKQAIGNDGWVYVLRIKSGFLLQTGVGGVMATEAEIAHLGPLKWKNVYGFLFRGDPTKIYLRNQFDTDDPGAFKMVLGALSNYN